MLKVLLVDDNRKALEGLRHHIRWDKTGCVCAATALNGQEALALTQELHPDIIITDVKMPLMSGLELCSRVHELFPNIHLIILSAHDEFDYARTAMRHGVESYVLKPIDAEKLIEIEGLLHGIATATLAYVETLSSFLDSTVGESLALGLRKGDPAEIDLLLRDVEELFSSDIRIVEHVAIQLLRLLKRTMQELGISGKATGLTAQIRQLHTLPSTHKMREYIHTQYHDACSAIYQKKSLNTEKLVGRIKAYIDSNYADVNFSTSLLSGKFSVSQSYLCHIYKAIEGTSINTYATTLRIAEACRLISGTGLSIVEIAARVGYLDAHYFAKVFRKLRGVTPTEFRRLHSAI